MKIQYLKNYQKEWNRLGYAKEGDAGFDLRAAIDVFLVLKPGERTLIPTGVKVAVPGGYEMQIRSRSGLTLKSGIIALNAPGTIDSGYRGEVGVILFNSSQDAFRVNPGDRIAQAVVSRFHEAHFEIVESLDGTERGSGGFGHTGET